MSAELLSQVRVVLSHPSHPGNMGAAARAMKTMGLRKLYLVNPKRAPDAEAVAMASAGADVLQAARYCPDLDSALQGTVYALAVSARRRELSHPAQDAHRALHALIAQARLGEVALVFGTEMSGLTNDEILKCSALAYIPADPEFSSLNLAAAVQVMAYETRLAAMDAPAADAPPTPAAPHEELERFYAHLEQSLIASGFLDPDHPKRLMPRFRRLFGRARLEPEEVNILRGMLKAWQRNT